MRFGLYVGSAVLLCAGVSAFADSTLVSGGFDGVSGSGTLTITDPNSAGVYTIVGIAGDPGTGVGSLIPASGFHGNDNLFTPGGDPLLDGHGFAFTDTQGDTSYSVDLFYDNGYQLSLLDSDGDTQAFTGTFTVDSVSSPEARRFASLADAGTRQVDFSFAASSAVTPEPASIALLGTGLLGLAGALRRRRR